MKLMILDKHILFRDGLSRSLTKKRNLEIIEAEPKANYFKQIVRHSPDVVIMDAEFFENMGKEIIRCVLSFQPQTAFLILETHEARNLSFDAIIAGARGYLPATTPLSFLLFAVEAITQGETVFPEFRAS